MMSHRWEQAEQIFFKAVEIRDFSARAEYLQTACGDDAILLAELTALLASHDRADTFLSAYSSLPGKMFSHYQVLEKIGEGATGTVYKARDSKLDRVVALKLLSLWSHIDPALRDRFVREAKYGSALNHPNIVTIHDIGHDQGMDFIVMECVDGRTLDQVIRPDGLPLDTCFQYALQITKALAKAHAAGIVHRDLKPANILVTVEDHIKLLDFGLAAPADGTAFDGCAAHQESTSSLGAILGTPGYLSPEQARGLSGDARSDIFSFGTVFYEMVTGERAFRRESIVETLTATRTKNPRWPEGVPANVIQILMRCLEKDPEKRFQNVVALVSALKAAQTEQGYRSQPGSRHGIFRGIALVVLIAIIFFSHSRGPIRGNHVLMLVAKFEGQDKTFSSRLVEQLRALTNSYSEVDIHLLNESLPKNQGAAVAVAIGRRAGARIVVWGRLEENLEHATLATHFALLDESMTNPLRREFETTTVPGSERNALKQELPREMESLLLTVVGADRYHSKDYAGASTAWTNALTRAASHNLINEPVVRFYRALADEQRVHTDCLDDGTAQCDFKGAIPILRRVTADLTEVLRDRPNHAASFWHRGLANSELCELYSEMHLPTEARTACNTAIDDFGKTLKPQTIYPRFFTDLPDEASVLWNRGLTYRLRVRVDSNDLQQLQDLTSSIGDFRKILDGSSQFAVFLGRRRSDLFRHLGDATKKREQLLIRSHGNPSARDLRS
jgi:serine/threonine protein kinase